MSALGFDDVMAWRGSIRSFSFRVTFSSTGKTQFLIDSKWFQTNEKEKLKTMLIISIELKKKQLKKNMNWSILTEKKNWTQ